MGHRTFKRVPLDFTWPKDKVWKGYVNPFYEACEKCPKCSGTGYSPEGNFLNATWYRHLLQGMFGWYEGANMLAVPDKAELERRGVNPTIIKNIEYARFFGFKVLAIWSDKLEKDDVRALVKAGRLIDFTHTWTQGKGWKKKKPAVTPTPDQVNAWSGRGGFTGHDSINQGVCLEHRCKKAGVSATCDVCDGGGEYWPDPLDKKRAEKWKESEPPAGPGWQLWETVSEGSPISPVFATADELAGWCADHHAMSPGSTLSKEQCLRLMHDKDELEVGSLMVMGPGIGVTTVAEANMGKPTPKDWTPQPK